MSLFKRREVGKKQFVIGGRGISGYVGSYTDKVLITQNWLDFLRVEFMQKRRENGTKIS